MDVCNLCNTRNKTFTIRICLHKICHSCVVNHIKEFTTAKIKCPVKICRKFISDSILRECFSNDQIICYDALCLPQNIFKCRVKDCNYFVAYTDKDAQFHCPSCQQPNCLRCSKLHYPSEKCGVENQEKYETAAVVHLNKIKRALIESVDQSTNLIPNPDSFNCEVCCEFFLPRTGVILRNCHHTFCRDCLKETYGGSQFLNQLVCSNCSILLHERERREFLGDSKLSMMSISAVKTKFFNCKWPDCDAIWDVGNFQGKYCCPKCKNINCIACKYVHLNQTCEEFRNTSLYAKTNNFTKILKERSDSINCYKCNKSLIIAPGGCGALHCNGCNSHVCKYTGKAVGPGGCNCTPSKPCHKDCRFGCIPE